MQISLRKAVRYTICCVAFFLPFFSRSSGKMRRSSLQVFKDRRNAYIFRLPVFGSLGKFCLPNVCFRHGLYSMGQYMGQTIAAIDQPRYDGYMQILVATRNKGKYREITEFLRTISGIEPVDPNDIDQDFDIVEDGKTFEENAVKKAKSWAEKSGMAALADDAGLEIDALGGEPGVLSRRWPGYEASDEELINMTLEKLQGKPEAQRTARLRTVMALVLPGGRTETAGAAIEGIIAEKPSQKREAGYPFRSLFWIPELGKFYFDLNEDEHKRYNHRRKALQKIIKNLETSS